MLHVYPVVLELVRQVGSLLPTQRARSAELADQCERALISIPLNVAEGAHSRGRNRHARYHTAAGSAREALACLETAQALGIPGRARRCARFSRASSALSCVWPYRAVKTLHGLTAVPRAVP